MTDVWPLLGKRLRDRRFWMVQVLVLAIAAAHTAIETMGALHDMRDLYLLPVSVFFVPVLYAALNFGLVGAVPTGLWCALLTAPNVVVLHSGAERIGVVLQLAFLVLLSSMVAIRVDKERGAKVVAEDANRRLAESQSSLKSYIGLALRAQEEERFRLSRELHDETVQELVVAKTALEDVSGTPAQRVRLELVDAALQRCIDGIRRFCRALRPSVLDGPAGQPWPGRDAGTGQSDRCRLHHHQPSRRHLCQARPTTFFGPGSRRVMDKTANDHAST